MIAGNPRQPAEAVVVRRGRGIAVPGLQQADDVLVGVGPPAGSAPFCRMYSAASACPIRSSASADTRASCHDDPAGLVMAMFFSCLAQRVVLAAAEGPLVPLRLLGNVPTVLDEYDYTFGLREGDCAAATT